jgi:hypothetical protein
VYHIVAAARRVSRDEEIRRPSAKNHTIIASRAFLLLLLLRSTNLPPKQQHSKFRPSFNQLG